MGDYMDKEFSQAVSSASNLQSAQISENYINLIKSEIRKLENSLNATGMQYGKQKADIAGGFSAEVWHGNTFNIDSALKDKNVRATVSSKNTLGSEDILLSNNTKIGAKYYADANRSAQSQATSLYEGQVRLIPSDQLVDARLYLERRIKEEAAKNPELAKDYREAYNQLSDRIQSEGVESSPLNKQQSTELAKKTKNGEYKAEDDGITEANLLKNNPRALLNKSLKTGLTAASMTMALELSPELLKMIKANVENSEYNYSDFIDKLGDVGQKGTDSFLLGTITTYIVGSSESGMLGEALENVSSEAIAGLVLIIFNTLKVNVAYTKGDITKAEMLHQISSHTIGVVGAAIGSAAFQFIPVVGTLVGSMVGSVIANSVYNQANNLLLGLSIENGCTFFGLVDQSYELPDTILKKLGFELMDYNEILIDDFEYDAPAYVGVEYDEINYDEIDIIFVKRGVVAVNKIGYI